MDVNCNLTGGGMQPQDDNYSFVSLLPGALARGISVISLLPKSFLFCFFKSKIAFFFKKNWFDSEKVSLQHLPITVSVKLANLGCESYLETVLYSVQKVLSTCQVLIKINTLDSDKNSACLNTLIKLFSTLLALTWSLLLRQSQNYFPQLDVSDVWKAEL